MSAPRDPFELDAEQMRRLGYEAVDRIIEHFTGVRDERVTNKIAPVDARARFSEPIPDEPADPHDVLRSAIDDVLSHAMRLDHPRFFAYIPSPNNFVSVIADALVEFGAGDGEAFTEWDEWRPKNHERLDEAVSEGLLPPSSRSPLY